MAQGSQGRRPARMSQRSFRAIGRRVRQDPRIAATSTAALEAEALGIVLRRCRVPGSIRACCLQIDASYT
jgi:hypothetical protein